MAVNETPPFWFERRGLKSTVLWPLAWVYSRGAALKMHAKPSGSVAAPVICVGNFIVGGGGKTPTCLALGQAALDRGLKPGFLSRGYGGKITTATMVDTKKHRALDVGDEPLLLARIAPTVVSSDRLTGANLLLENGCDFIIMDDGFQNPRLQKDYNLVVVDSRRGIGNAMPMPAGPLRLDLRPQLILADAVLVVGLEAGADSLIRTVAKAGKPIYRAALAMRNAEYWKGRWILPYAGIADPDRFFVSMRRVGAEIAGSVAFGDHHFYSPIDSKELLDRSKLAKAELVTTTKDFVRLMGMGEHAEKLAKASSVVQVSLEFEDSSVARLLIDKTLANFENRQLGN